ncbi:hypothetical protein [Haloarcula onubensis]|uniref:Uncharacterized protein n=1 Tax=Haloarcula onubensis TaxID=2950539 RepID=A0ABU2FIN8_9EURY|nr:hypothetical protein [Halomicroarcula sp. S3CR25-11]MDS0280630.1 hypothetical protein [Halomicroarcula sp. S3CR25-11]
MYSIPTADSTAEEAEADTNPWDFGDDYTVPTTGSSSEEAEADTNPNVSDTAVDEDDRGNDLLYPPQDDSDSSDTGQETPDAGGTSLDIDPTDILLSQALSGSFGDPFGESTVMGLSSTQALGGAGALLVLALLLSGGEA